MSTGLKNYTWVTTADGSPSLHQGEGEWMHSSGGAFTESLYIYGEAVTESLERGWMSFISVGLGLAYNELIVFSEAQKKGINSSELRLRSFESDPHLVDALLAALNAVIHSLPLDPLYEKLFGIFQNHYQFSDEDFKRVCQNMLLAQEVGHWDLSPSLSQSTRWPERYNTFLYDAFSAKTCPELWQEEFLISLIDQAARPESLFTTYACTGALKRSLKANGFEVIIRKGFFIKKDSTLGRRAGPSAFISEGSHGF